MDQLISLVLKKYKSWIIKWEVVDLLILHLFFVVAVFFHHFIKNQLIKLECLLLLHVYSFKNMKIVSNYNIIL